MKRILFLLFPLLLLAVKVQATDRWATASGGGGSTCSYESPCTPTVAKSQLVAGDNWRLKNGVYVDFQFEDPLPSGISVSQPTCMIGESRASTIIRPTAGGNTILLGANRSNICFKDFTMDGISQSNSGSKAAIRTNSSTIITGLVIDNILIKRYGYNLLTCTPNVGGLGLVIGDGTDGAIIRNSTFDQNGCWSQPPAENPVGHGVYYRGAGGLIEHNHFTNNKDYGIQLYSGANYVDNNILRYNYMDGNQQGFYAARGNGNYITNNVSVNNRNSGAVISIGSGTETNYFYNNIFYGNKGGATYTYTYNCTLKNNLFFGSMNGYNDAACATNVGNQTGGTATDYLIDPANGKFCLKSSSPAINSGVVIPGFSYNGTFPDKGACETISFSSATVNGNSMDISFGMNLNVPLLPASGIIGFTVNNGRNVTSVTRLSDSVVRLVFDGAACTVGQTWTFSYSGTGNLTDSLKIGDPSGTTISQPIFAITNQSVTNSCGGTPPPDPPPGLYIHYKLNDGSGTNANDETINNLDGTLTSGPTWVAGRTGSNAVAFAANVQDYIAVPYGNGVNPSTQSLTIAFDVLTDGSQLTNAFTVFAAPAGTNQRLNIGSVDNTWTIGIQGSAAATNNEFPISASWARLCLVMNSSTDTATLHVNGVAGTSAQSIKSYTSYSLSGNFDIGRISGVTNVRGFSIDNFKLWTTVESCADDYASEYPQSPTSGTFTQASYKFYLLRKDPSGNLVSLPMRNASVNVPILVPSGAVFNVDLQTNCDNVADCNPISQTLQYEVNSSGSWLVVSDNCSVKMCFYGTSDTDVNIPSGVPSCPLSGVLTCVNGGTQRTASAIPSIDMAQNNSTVNRYIIQNNASIGDIIKFRLVNQNGEVFGTYSQYPTINTVANFAGSAS